MSKSREVRAFDYVNQPYGKVREALSGHALEIFRGATRAAASRAHSVATGLRVNIGGIEVGAPIEVTVKTIDQDVATPISGRPISGEATRLSLEWEAAKAPRLFPLMKGHLSVYALTSTETQLDFDGQYEPPLGALGSAIDAIAGHRIAEASVHRFVSDIARYLRDNLTEEQR